MKLDHFVIHIDEKYQKDEQVIEQIRNMDFPYEPKWGKGTKGFKVSNLWIGNEYLEMVHLLKADGGGWVDSWVKKYQSGHRGLICLMLDVDHIDTLSQTLLEKNIAATQPEWLEFKWFFNLLTRRMPWRNCYLPFFNGLPLQIGFQEMKDDKSRDFMNQYMVPNSRDNGIERIDKVIIKGAYSQADLQMLVTVFDKYVYSENNSVKLALDSGQTIEFITAPDYQAELYTNASTNRFIEIENVKIYC